MAIQKEFIIRYRTDGHVRFQIPQRAAQTTTAARLTQAIQSIDGVSNVKLFVGSRKLSVRYDTLRCSLHEFAQRLHYVLSELEQQGCFKSQELPVTHSPGNTLAHKFQKSRVFRWVDEKIQIAKETAQAAKILGKLASQGPKNLARDPEKAVIDFLNDILVMYLIKVHWTRITQQWLVRPLAHRYEWLATFYLFFLLVRSRRSK